MRRVHLGMAATVVLFLAACGVDGGSEDVPAVTAHGATAVDWAEDWQTAFERADREGKPVLVSFYADWCVWCKRLESTTYRDAGVASVLASEVVPVNLDVDAEGRELSDDHRVNGLPTVVLFAPDGREIGRIGGYLPPGKFLDSLREILGPSPAAG